MLVREVVCEIVLDADGRPLLDREGLPIVIEREVWIERADVVTAEQQAVADAVTAQHEANEAGLQSQAEQALVGLRSYRDQANPTTAQTVAAVKLLCRVAIALIRLFLRKFEGTT
jgi:hypothetical protein